MFQYLKCIAVRLKYQNVSAHHKSHYTAEQSFKSDRIQGCIVIEQSLAWQNIIKSING